MPPISTQASTPGTTDHAWPLGPDPARWAACPPLLGAGAVHIWRADLAAVDDEVWKTLSGEERERAERILNERRRQLWMRSRGVLRTLLGGYLSQNPRTLSFAVGTHGKPALLGDGTGADFGAQPLANTSAAMSFNMSHSGDLALYAFTTTGPIGVDVEVVRRPIDAVGIARRAFGIAEAERLAALEPNAREQEFLRAWVRHEAELKRLGSSIGASDETAEGAAAAGWIIELEVLPRAAAAVATGTRPDELHCWAWS